MTVTKETHEPQGSREISETIRRVPLVIPIANIAGIALYWILLISVFTPIGTHRQWPYLVVVASLVPINIALAIASGWRGGWGRWIGIACGILLAYPALQMLPGLIQMTGEFRR